MKITREPVKVETSGLKFVPVIVTGVLGDPAVAKFGLTLETVGGAAVIGKGKLFEVAPLGPFRTEMVELELAV